MFSELQLRVKRLIASSRLYRKRAAGRYDLAIPVVPRLQLKDRDEQTRARALPRSSEEPKSPVVGERSQQLCREKRRRVPAGPDSAKSRTRHATSQRCT